MAGRCARATGHPAARARPRQRGRTIADGAPPARAMRSTTGGRIARSVSVSPATSSVVAGLRRAGRSNATAPGGCTGPGVRRARIGAVRDVALRTGAQARPTARAMRSGRKAHGSRRIGLDLRGGMDGPDWGQAAEAVETVQPGPDRCASPWEATWRTVIYYEFVDRSISRHVETHRCLSPPTLATGAKMQLLSNIGKNSAVSRSDGLLFRAFM